MSYIIVPKKYKPQLNLIETEIAIKLIKDTFEQRLSKHLSSHTCICSIIY